MRKKLRITVTGIFPIMMDQMSDEVLKGLITGIRPQLRKDRPFEEMAAGKIYRDDDNRIGIPTTMLYAALVEAGRSVPFKGKTMISTAETTKLFGLMEIMEEFLPFPIPDGEKEVPWIVDKRLGRLPKDGTAVGLIRPKFPKWGFTCTVIFDEKTQIGQDTVELLFRTAGQFQGLGSFRPNCRGPFGRFAIHKVEDITPEEWKNEDTSNTTGSTSQVDPEDVEVEVEEPTGNLNRRRKPQPAGAGAN